MATISVIIPVYNAFSYLKRCVDALENQTFKDFEVVFVDDCSSDNTVAELHRISVVSTIKMTVLSNHSNCGPAYSRNKGIERADSKYITFCDVDDWYERDFLEVLYQIITKNDADIVFCGYKVVSDNEVNEERPVSSYTGAVSHDMFFSLDADSLCMMMTRTQLMKETLLPDIRNGEDVAAVSLLMAKAKTIAVSERCLYNYYRRQGSASETPTMRVVDSLCESFEYTKRHFPAGKKVELEFLGAKNLLYGALISLFSFGYNTCKASAILSEFEKEFPKWEENPYLPFLNRNKRIVLRLLSLRCYIGVRCIAIIRNWRIKK